MKNLDNSINNQKNKFVETKFENPLFKTENKEIEFKNLLSECFNREDWLGAFLNDNHHGFLHGNQVRLSCLKLMDNLTDIEKNDLLKEVGQVDLADSEQYAKLIVEIAAVFHDAGRFNEQGKVVSEEQKLHQILSAERAKKFCVSLGLNNIIPFVEDAILCHDFQSSELTPDLNPPKYISGKIVQASDQMGWFHPDSVKRTLDYNKALGNPFYDLNTTLSERMAWKPGNIAKDAFTVMICQLFGPTGEDRFGLESARQKIKTYKKDLENNILKIAKEYGLEDEVGQQINVTREASLEISK